MPWVKTVSSAGHSHLRVGRTEALGDGGSPVADKLLHRWVIAAGGGHFAHDAVNDFTERRAVLGVSLEGPLEEAEERVVRVLRAHHRVNPDGRGKGGRIPAQWGGRGG